MNKPILKYIYIKDGKKESEIVFDFQIEEGYFARDHKQRIKDGWKLFEKRKYLGEIKGVSIFEGDLIMAHLFGDSGHSTQFIRMTEKRMHSSNWGTYNANGYIDVKDIFPFRKIEAEEDLLSELKYELESWDKHIMGGEDE